MDLHMPKINGCDTIAELTRRGFGKPVIAVTAYAMTGERRKKPQTGRRRAHGKTCG